MVKMSTNSIKAKDIDNQRLTKRIQRLEKLVEINKNLGVGDRARMMNDDYLIHETNEEFEETGMTNKPVKINDQVTQELLQHQFDQRKQQ